MTEDNRSKQRDSSGRFIKGNDMEFQPGQSGNPGGKLKDPGITKSQIEMLDQPCPYAKDPKTTWRMWLAEKGLILATQKEMALEHLKERLEGKVTQPIGGDSEGLPIKLEFIPAKEE